MGQEIASPSGKVKAAMTSFGLSLRSDVVGTVWDSAGAGRYAMMGNDGNLVVCDDAGTVLWQTDTAGADGACLVVDDQPTDNWLTVRKGSTAVWTWCPRPKGPYLAAESRLLYGQEIFSQKGTTKLALTDRGLVLSGIGPAGWTTSWEVLTDSPCAYARFGGRPELDFPKQGLTVQDLIARTSYRLMGSHVVTTAAPSVVSGAIASSLFALGSTEPVTQYVVADGCVLLLGANNRQIGWLGTQFIQ